MSAVPPAAASTADVRLPGTFFEPKTITIAPGDTVRWAYADDAGRNHTVTSQAGEVVTFDSHENCSSLLQLDCFSPGDDPFPWAFERESDYVVDYYCKIHGSRTRDPDDPACGMCGKVRVVLGSTPQPSPTDVRATLPTDSQELDEEPLAPLAGPTATGTSSPGVVGGPGGGELAGGPEGSGGSGGRLGLAFLFLLMLATAARVVYRRYLLDPFAARRAGPTRDPHNPLF